MTCHNVLATEGPSHGHMGMKWNLELFLEGPLFKSEILQLDFDRDIPIDIILKDEGAIQSLLDDSTHIISSTIAGKFGDLVAYRSATFTCARRHAYSDS